MFVNNKLQECVEICLTKKAHGYDNITANELQMVAKEISPGLAFINNQGFRQGKYPSDWKIAKVNAVYKKGKKDDCQNYRPFSMLSIPSKISESIVCDLVDQNLYNKIQTNQWGFQKGLSTESLLLYLTENWRLNLDNNKVIGTIFVDFKKAFDSVDHQIL